VRSWLVLTLETLIMLVSTPAAFACHPPAREGRIHVSFLADSDLPAMVKWAKESTCVDYLFDHSLASRRLGQSVILTVTGADVGTTFELLLHSMNLRVRNVGSHRQVVADGPETDQSKDTSQRDNANAERDRIFDNIGDEIRRIDDRHFRMTRRGADATMANLRLVARSIQVEPEVRDNRTIGFRLASIKRTSILARLGFLDGDVVESINGRELTSPDKAVEAYAKLRSASRFEVRALRNEIPLVIELKIE